MALTATYIGDLSRIRLVAGSLGASATYAVFDWTVNGITYSGVRGGLSASVTSGSATLDHYEWPAGQPITYRVRSYSAANVLQATFTAVITQTLDKPWLKSVARVYMNREIHVADASDVTHKSRAGVFPVVGRSYPVSVSDVFSARSYDLTVGTVTQAEADDLRLLVTSGDPVFLHVPNGFPAPGGYYVVGDLVETRQDLPWDRRWFTLPLTEVAAPGPDVIGSLGTWQTVLNTYATWADVMAAKATWADLLELVGDPSEVIVP